MIIRRRTVFILIVLTVIGRTAAADPAGQLAEIIEEHWAYSLDEDPISASRSGAREYDNRLPNATPAAARHRANTESKFLQRLADIDTSKLSDSEKINKELLTWVLQISLNSSKQDTDRIPFNIFSGFFSDALRSHSGLSMTREADYEAYIERLNEIPRYFDENISNMRRGISTGMVLPKVIIDGIAPTIRAQLKDAPRDSELYKPFTKLPERIDSKTQRNLRRAATRAITDSVYPAIKNLADFLEGDYYQAASDTVGISARPDGNDYYQHQIEQYVTLTDLSPQEIHDIGLEEVARIRTEMNQIITELKFDGDFSDFTDFLRTDPQFYAKSAEELLSAAAYTAKRADHVMPEFFGVLPRSPYGVVPVPAAIAPNYTTAAYNPAPIGGIRGGEYWVNTYALDQRPLYELPALTLHEAVPGHHHQHALAQEAGDVPEFRRQLYFSAFGEGWGLYTEKLGIEMGMYRTPYEHFGRLSYEMWRACRLVIDTGIHAMGWTRQQALDYLGSNTSLSTANVRAEVDRYISWPGQALAYKIGELKIWELRRQAEATLGERFDLRRFHDRLLANGALPLTMLEADMHQFIQEERRR